MLEQPRELRFRRVRLTVIDGPNQGRSIDFAENEISIGTAAENDLVVDDQAVSRHHVAITPTPRGHLVRDLDSTNGTTINGVRVERASLTDRAVLAIGTTRIQFEPLEDETRTAISSEDRWGRALGVSDAMRRLFAVLPKVAASDVTVLIEGETGTGKSLLASAIHEASPRAAKPFVVVDCATIPPNLIESELFGHEKGAFTGALGTRVGAFELADGGTVFLDEVGELPLDLQPKLLRALEDRIIKRVGGNEQRKMNVRVIAATNRELRAEINRGRFRSDLYYRLNTFSIRVVPLRERRDDVALLVAHFYRQLHPQGEEPPAELLAELLRHEWPGNVRELRAAVERTVLLGDPAVWREITEPSAGIRPADDTMSFRAAKEQAVAAWEREYLRALVARFTGNLSRAARAVRMDRNHLRELLVRHGLRTDDS
ncbi:MAG TPA: sigma 54-interacting transcriptional regulator [Kofleriaceae bacterium]|nr:sigma 54-interacting transcriptional regulator [Kofleriaceae bacterium]